MKQLLMFLVEGQKERLNSCSECVRRHATDTAHMWKKALCSYKAKSEHFGLHYMQNALFGSESP